MDGEKHILELSLLAPSEPCAYWLRETEKAACRIFPSHSRSTEAASMALRAASEACTLAVTVSKGIQVHSAEQIRLYVRQWFTDKPPVWKLRMHWVNEQKEHAWPVYWARKRWQAVQDQGV